MAKFGKFLGNQAFKQIHQEIDFFERALPVFGGEGIGGEDGNAPVFAATDEFFEGFGSLAVSGDAKEVALFGPASVAVHDEGDVLREKVGVEWIVHCD